MALSISEFLKLIVQSRLLTPKQCQQLSASFAQTPNASAATGKTMAEWLVRQNVLSKYQAIILLAGRAGPFFYGEYKIYERLEAGRLSGMFRAVHAATNHPVVLRFLAGPITQSPPAWAEMLRWLPICTHPNLVRYHEAADLGSFKFLVMEDLRGQSLAELLERTKRIPADEASRLARLAAMGLSRLHENGRVLGDVRPHHLWLEQNGNVKVLFEPDAAPRGFSVLTAPLEPDGAARADYAAPEFIQPGRPADPLSDIYALGCTLYQLVAGQPPFPGGDVTAKMQRHATEAIKSLDALGAPPPLTQVVAYAMAKNPAVRFQQAGILAEQLVPFIGAAQQNFRPTGPLPTQGQYELHLQQRQSAPANQPVIARRIVAANPVIAPQLVAAASAAAVSPVVGTRATSSVATTIKRRAKARQRANIMFLAFSIVLAAGAVGAVIYFTKNPGLVTSPPKQKAPAVPVTPGELPTEPNAGNPPTATSPAPPVLAGKSPPTNAPVNANVVQDDGQTLWSAPTAGPAIQLKYVPPGAQLFAILRPTAMLAHPEGERTLKALGPKFASGLAAWETEVGVKFADVDQLIVALFANQGQPPKAAYVVRLKADIVVDELKSKWGSITTVAGVAGMFTKDAQAFFLPGDNQRTFVVGPHEPEMKDAAANSWKPPLLRREIGQLLQASDDQRHVTILFAPNFLFGDGQELFAGDRQRAKQPLQWFLGDGLKAGMLSLHFADPCYFELRMESDIQLDRHQLASQVRERLAQVPNTVESYIAELNPHPYWRLVAFRFPAMVRFMHEYSRIGVDMNHAVVSGVLPQSGPHNLIFGGEMVLASTPGMAVAATGGPTKPAAPKNNDEALQAKISIAFAADSLEFSMQNIVTELKATFPDLPFDFQIKILGTDLEKDGITRNQQIRDFNHPNKTVAEVLTAMVMKANPITTVKAPNEVDQKLLWVVGPNPDNPAQQIVLITTRAAAALKKYTLPAVFQVK